jgi:hypothetical protein
MMALKEEKQLKYDLFHFYYSLFHHSTIPWLRPLAQTWHARAEFYGLYTRSITVAL